MDKSIGIGMIIHRTPRCLRSVKIAITIEEDLLKRLDHLVEENKFPKRSQAVQEAIRDKLRRIKRSRLASECA
jgi:metal-responsive CopG/Arc/MetJ family transcriptional regulator